MRRVGSRVLDVVVGSCVALSLGAQERPLGCRTTPTPGTGPMLDAAVAADGATWTVDVNAGRLLRIDSAGGGRFVHAGAMQRQQVSGVARGPGEAIWYLLRDGVVGRLDPGGTGATESTLEGRVAALGQLRRAPDGSLWFLDVVRDRIGHVALDGTVRLLEPPQSLTRRGTGSGGGVQSLRAWPKSMKALAVAPDGALWIGSNQDDALFRIEPANDIRTRRVDVPAPRAQIAAIDVAGDGTVWVALAGARAVGHVAPGAATMTVHPVDGRAEHVLAARDGGAWFATATGVGHVTRDGRVRQVDCGGQMGPLVEHPRSGVRSLGNQRLAHVDTGETRAVATTTRRVAVTQGAPARARAADGASGTGATGPRWGAVAPNTEGIHPVAPAALDSALATVAGSVVVYFTSDDGSCAYCSWMNDSINRLVRETQPGTTTYLWVSWNPWRRMSSDPLRDDWALSGLPTLVHLRDGDEVARVTGVQPLASIRRMLSSGVRP